MGRPKPFSGGRTIVQELSCAQNGTHKRYSGCEVLNISPSTFSPPQSSPSARARLRCPSAALSSFRTAAAEAIIDLLESRMQNAEDTMMNGMAADVYSDGTATGQITGLQALVSTAPTSGTIGGIDRDDLEFWRNIAYSAVTDGGAAATSPANIQRYMNAVALQLVRGNDGPDLIVAANGYLRAVSGRAFRAIQRITDEKMAGSGFTSLKYFGAGRSVDVVLDGGFQGYSSDTNPTTGGARANTMYFLNTNYIFYRPHRDRNMVPLDPDRFSVNQDAMVAHRLGRQHDC